MNGERGSFTLSGNQLDVWVVRLVDSEDFLQRHSAVLSDDERERARRFRFPRDRNRFIVGRSALRTLLAGYTGQAPSAIRFSYSYYGKPELAGSRDGLAFNVAHSGDLAVFAFGRFESVGIDVEQMTAIPELDMLARRFFAPNESAELMSLPEPDRLPAFYRCWTRKEAYLKALGHGLAKPLDGFEVSFAADEPARLRRVLDDADEPERWSLSPFEPAAGAVAAAAVRHQNVVVRSRGVYHASAFTEWHDGPTKSYSDRNWTLLAFMP